MVSARVKSVVTVSGGSYDSFLLLNEYVALWSKEKMCKAKFITQIPSEKAVSLCVNDVVVAADSGDDRF